MQRSLCSTSFYATLVVSLAVSLLAFAMWSVRPQTVYAQTTVVIYVDADASGPTYDGLSWTTAYTNVQDALDLTNANSGTAYEIWVAEGVYYPDEGGSHIDNDPYESFRIDWNNVQLYGGFSGYGISETLRTQRNWTAHPTILSGDIDDDDANADGNFIAETWADIQGSNAWHVLYVDGSSNQNITGAVVIDGFIVTAGNAVNANVPNHFGGGLYCIGSDGGDHVASECSPTLANLIFSGNGAYFGGAVVNRGDQGVSGPVFTNVTFRGNQAITGGGMLNLAAVGVSSPHLTNVTFHGNRADFGGALANLGQIDGTSSPTLTNVLFSGNQAISNGGAMINSGEGGVSSPLLTNVTFSGNRAEVGGAIHNASMDGGASSPMLINTILWGNTATTSTQIHNDAATMLLAYSTVEGGCPADAQCKAGTKYTNPNFIAPIAASSAPTLTGNYRLRAGSPAIDGGDNAAVTAATDRDGRPRIANGVVDMGAYEIGILYVDEDRLAGAHTGLSWTDAFTNVQDALDVTNADSGANYEIWVAAGVYYPDEGGAHIADAVTESFRIGWNNVQLYGGFGGYGISETLRTERDWVAHPTILSGDIDQNDTNSDGNFIAETWDAIQGSNAWHVLYLDGVTNQRIDAATVIDGFTVTAGSASGASSPNLQGGGIYCAGNASGMGCSPALANVTFSGNQAYSPDPFTLDIPSGGGMYNNGSVGGVSSPTLNNVTFSGNRAAEERGGGVGGGMYNDGRSGVSSPTLTNVTFSGNRAGASGGGMMNLGSYGASSPTLTNVLFHGNQGTSGGGMANLGNYGASSPTLTNVTFSGNTARFGGGIYSLAENGASRPTLANCVLWGNTASNGGPQLFDTDGAASAVTDSIVQGGYAGSGNLDADPLFVAPVAASSAPTTTGNYRLQACSPAIDAGNTLSVTAATDLDGRPRIVNNVVDMGAYEAARMACLHVTKAVAPAANVPYQGVITYTLTLSNSGAATDTVRLTDALPAQVAFGGWVTNPGALQTNNAITWTGELIPAAVLTFTFTATNLGANGEITNTAAFSALLQTGQASASFSAVKAAAMTALVNAPATTVYSQSVIFTATVTANPPGANLPTGAVTFTTASGVLGTRNLDVGGVATVTTASLPIGSHVVTATYGGDANFIGSGDSLTQTVTKLGAAVTAVSAPNPSAYGQNAVFTVTVAAATTTAFTPTGAVTLTVGGVAYLLPLSDGVATRAFGELEPGAYTTTASYGGDAIFAPGTSSPYAHTVAKSAVAAALAPTPNPATYGEDVSVPVTVTALYVLPAGGFGANKTGGLLAPTGVVTLYDGAAHVTGGVLLDGLATLYLPLPAGGVHTLTVVYGGDDRYSPGQATAQLLVNPAPTTSTLTGPPAPTLYGQPAVFTATVAAQPLQSQGTRPQPALPGGQVHFFEGLTFLGSGALIDGATHFTASLWSGGVHTLTARYLGDSNYLTSTAATTHTVQPLAPVVSLAAAPNPSLYQQAVIFTATVPAPGLGLATPTGAISFQRGATVLGVTALTNGVATLTTSDLPGGDHAITGHYSGDANYQAAVSDALTQTVLYRVQAAADPVTGGAVAGGGLYAHGATVIVTATASSSFTFTHWAEGGQPVAATTVYSFTAAGHRTLTAVFTPLPLPLAFNDAAGVLEGEAVDVAVLANDRDPAGGGLTVVAITPPAQGAASINPDGRTVHYAAPLGHSGLVSLTYTVQDVNGQQSRGLAAIVVTALRETDVAPQIAVVDPAVQSTQSFTSSQATVTAALPAGFFPGTIGLTQVFFLSYTPVITPTAPTQTPPGALQFVHFEFELMVFLDDQPQPGALTPPLVLTIRYDPALLRDLDPPTLGLFRWDGTSWRTDGITPVSHDVANGVLTVALSSLGDFAFFAAAIPTALDPAPEPGATPVQLYLPAVMSEASSVRRHPGSGIKCLTPQPVFSPMKQKNK